MCKVSDCFRITFILVFYLFLFLNTAQALSIHSKKYQMLQGFWNPFRLKKQMHELHFFNHNNKLNPVKFYLILFIELKEMYKQKTQGVLLIDSKDRQIFKRLFLIDEQGELLVDYIFYEGDTSKVWKRVGSHSTFDELDDEELFLPLIEGILFRPVDILMPYIYWGKYSYEGPKAFGINSVVHNYLFSAENKLSFLSQGILSVRLSIDSKYNSVRKIEYLNETEALNQLQFLELKNLRAYGLSVVWFLKKK